MNWDQRGRLWVVSSPLYPHIKPGQGEDDKIVILEDTNGDGIAYKSTVPEPTEEGFMAQIEARRRDELDRGITLVGPHRDDVVLSLGDLPVKGYASHGESWSFALALRLAAYDVLRADGDDPILILDDVFAELDSTRRDHLAELVATAEQVLVTAAVGDDVPELLAGARFEVAGGEVTRV